ncbi:hypothetical protein LCGC14_0154550 [marine sediment metagenome]|uniref:DUF3618 domain-containing protein n=1 Tax=marine sediment metagenome TaxID=412755 RepID=A0A0F9XZ34_9ZZZZ|nr:DUF3618 domain-containing protein [Halomonas sp.]HDZ47053.1 DUF3618 domain-containing protein [Halomonas sp.]HEB06871.1 DUF3618 domain-containing protein [Halomonas sp.]
MTDHDKQRNSEEIERDINQSRERLDSTLHEIEERFSPQQLLNTSYEYLRHGGANEFVSNLGTTIKQNPLPFLLTSAGIGWLMLAQRNPNEARQHRYASPVDQRFYSGAENSYGTPAGVAGAPEHHTDSEGRLSEMAHKAKDSAHHLSDRAKQTAHQWGEKAHHMGDSMRESTSHLQHGAQDSLHSMGQRTRQTQQQASDFIQEHPLVVGALGFALGAALGGIFPATKKEDEYFGEYRDRALHKAAQTGQEQMDKAQHSLHEKVESYKEASHQGKVSQDKEADVNAPQDKASEVKDTPVPAEKTSPEQRDRPGMASSEQGSSERHSQGLANSNTPSGNTQGSGTNRTP